jgi:hypothetical protein
MSIVFLPFPTEVLGRVGGRTATIFYAGSMLAAGAVSLLNTWYVLHAGLASEPADATVVWSGIAFIVLFGVSIPVGFLSVTAAQVMWGAAVLVRRVVLVVARRRRWQNPFLAGLAPFRRSSPLGSSLPANDGTGPEASTDTAYASSPTQRPRPRSSRRSRYRSSRSSTSGMRATSSPEPGSMARAVPCSGSWHPRCRSGRSAAGCSSRSVMVLSLGVGTKPVSSRSGTRRYRALWWFCLPPRSLGVLDSGRALSGPARRRTLEGPHRHSSTTSGAAGVQSPGR